MRMSCLVLLPVSATASAGCTERELDYRAASGRAEVALVWVGLNRPSTAGHRSYGADNKLVPMEGIVAEVSVDSFSIVLLEGCHGCFAYNIDTQGVIFTGLDNRLPTEVRLSSEAQPGNMYSWSVEEVEVIPRGNVCYTSVPLHLMKQVVLRLQVMGVEGAAMLNGTLNGVYPSFFLLSGDPPEQSIRTAPETVAQYITALAQIRNTGSPSYTVSADIRPLGLLDPQKEEGNGDETTYGSRLNLTVHNSSGEVYSTTVNMNKPVSEIIDSYGGEIPTDKTIEIDVSASLPDMNLMAVVQGWKEGDKEVTIIK